MRFMMWVGNIVEICDLLFANQTRSNNATNSYTSLG